jgi:hypothetical protein
MRPRRLGISNYHLFWRRQVQTYLDPAAARLLLGQFKDDPSAMRDLRALLEDPMLGIPNDRRNDDQVLDAVARLVAGGEVLMVREWPMHGGAATQPQKAGQADDATPATPPQSRKSEPPENPTLPNTNGAAQAAALSAAAASGAPFCDH